MPDDDRPTDVDLHTSSAPTSDVDVLDDPTTTHAIPPERYRITTTIGRGGMGEVVAARDIQIGREVAIKRIHGTPSPLAMSRFLREARIQGRLDHPAIVPVHELSHDDHGNPFFVMKRVSGTTLHEILRSSDPELRARFPRERLLRALADICLAVEFAHRRGVIHRDLKPANIILGEFGEVYVLDWGIARVIADDELAELEAIAPDTTRGTTLAGAVVGTPGYMSPEQARGERDLDARADVFALGCILYEILARTPMLAPVVAAVFDGYDARPSRAQHASGVPPELDEVCVLATRPERADRIASARALHERVQRFLDGDRDLALRRRLAKDHVDEAFVAFARRDDAEARRIAMQAAGRALALDPTATEAATLVTRLMLEPPPVMPREVLAEVERLDAIETRNLLQLATVASLAYVLFLPILWWLGTRDAGYLWLLGGAVLANSAVVAYGWWRDERRWTLALSVVTNSVVIAILSRLLSPFLVAPGVAAVATMAWSLHPRLGRRPLWIVFATGVLAPWVLELAGTWPRTLASVDGRLVIDAPAVVLRLPQAELALALYTLAVLVVAWLVARAMARAQYDLRCRLQLQAWQMRQLVPS